MRVGLNIINHSIKNMAIQQPTPHLIALKYCIQSLLASDIREFDWVMVTLDNGSTCRESEEYIESLGDIEGIIPLRVDKNLGIPRARNLVSRELIDAECDYIVEIHSDHFFPSVWARPILEHLEKNLGIGIECSGIISTCPFPGAKIIDSIYTLPYEDALSLVEMTATRECKNIIRPGLVHPAIKRVEMLNQIGLYEEDLPVNQCHEDVEEVFRAKQEGWHVVINRNSFVYHHQYYSRGVISAQVEPMDQWLERLKQNTEFFIQKHGALWVWWTVEYNNMIWDALS